MPAAGMVAGVRMAVAGAGAHGGSLCEMEPHSTAIQFNDSSPKAGVRAITLLKWA